MTLMNNETVLARCDSVTLTTYRIIDESASNTSNIKAIMLERVDSWSIARFLARTSLQIHSHASTITVSMWKGNVDRLRDFASAIDVARNGRATAQKIRASAART